jgi:hypothetical protein
MHRLAGLARGDDQTATVPVGSGRENQRNSGSPAHRMARVQNTPPGSEGCATEGIERMTFVGSIEGALLPAALVRCKVGTGRLRKVSQAV